MFKRYINAYLKPMALLVSVIVLGGCTANTSQQPKLPLLPAAFQAESHSNASLPSATLLSQWWQMFSDQQLDDLIARVDRNNTTVQQALARVAQARAVAQIKNADRQPQIGFGTGVTRQGGPLVNAAGSDGTLISTSVNFSYEVDLFNRLSKNTMASVLETKVREATLSSVRLMMQAEVAQTYFSLRVIDEERALLKKTAEAYRETSRLLERRQRAGLLAELDVVRLQTEASAVEADALALDRRRAELEHMLAFLTGDIASSFALPVADWDVPLPQIAPGLPSTLLLRRPDVAAAHYAMDAANMRLGAAETAWFPSLNLTASGGYASPALSDLLKVSTQSWGVGVLTALPILDGGRRAASVKNASAELDLANAAYREQILTAFREVEDQLSGLHLLSEQAATLQAAVTSAEHATKLSESRFGNGLGDRLDILDAYRTELRVRRALLQARSSRLTATVDLVRALGGGWSETVSGS